MQLVFENGQKSEVLEAQNSKYDSWKSFSIDPSKEIRYVRMGVKYGVFYTGIWFLDENFKTVAKEVWRESGVWVAPQPIPTGQHIVGIKADSKKCDSCLQAVSFLLGEIGVPGTVKDLRFPQLQVSLTKSQFYDIHF